MKTILYELKSSDCMQETHNWCLIQHAKNPEDSRMSFFSDYIDEIDDTFGLIQSIDRIKEFKITSDKVYNPHSEDLWVRKLEFETKTLLETGIMFNLNDLPPELRDLMPEIFL